MARAFSDTLIHIGNILRALSSSGLRLEDDAGNLGIMIEDGGLVGVGSGATSPTTALHVAPPAGNTAANIPVRLDRSSSATTGLVTAGQFVGISTGNMADTFGPSYSFYIRDDAGVDNLIARLAAVRDGADNSGSLVLWTTNAGSESEKFRIKPDGKVGVNQSAPTAQLHVVQGATTGEALRVIRDLAAASTDSPLVNLIQDNATDDQVALRLQQDGTGDIVNVFDGATEVVTVLDGGNTGLNMTAPSDRLEVGGAVSVGDATDGNKDGILRVRRDLDPVLLFYDADNTTIDGRLQATTNKVMFTSADGVTDHLTVETDTGDVGIATNDPTARLEINATGATTALKLIATATNDDPYMEYRTPSRGTTTNATLTTFFSVPIPTDTVCYLEIVVMGRRTGGTGGTAGDSAVYYRKGAYTNKGGTVALLGGSLLEVIDREDNAAWDCQLNISGTNVNVQVQGAANNNITWHRIEYKFSSLST